MMTTTELFLCCMGIWFVNLKRKRVNYHEVGKPGKTFSVPGHIRPVEAAVRSVSTRSRTRAREKLRGRLHLVTMRGNPAAYPHRGR